MKTLKKRKKQRKTDYLKRLKLLKSELPRIVFRRTNKYVIVQYVISEEAKDKILYGINSKELLKYGWPEEFKGSLKSIPASYLTGLLFGKKILEKKLENKIIIDLGMLITHHKTKVFAFIKGLKDSGIKVNCKEEAFPELEKIKGKFMKKDFSQISEKIKSKIQE